MNHSVHSLDYDDPKIGWMIASIGFTISSVISSNSSFQRIFPRHYRWTDFVVFVIISMIIISSLVQYETSITIWLVPILILGLGYGFLVRTHFIKNIRAVTKSVS